MGYRCPGTAAVHATGTPVAQRAYLFLMAGYAAAVLGRPQRCWRSLRMRARSRRWAARTSGWRALALRQRRYSCSLRASTAWLGWSEPPITKVRTGPNCASIGLAQEALVGVKHSSTLARFAQRRMAGVLFAERVVQDHEQPVTVW